MPRSFLSFSSFLSSFAILIAGCASIAQGPPLPLKHSVVCDQLVINSDFNLPSHHQLVEELVNLRQRLAKKLALEVSQRPIQVYLFDTKEKYQDFITSHFPEFPERRAFFVESDTRLSVYAHWGDRVGEDLRHEVSHGYLHASVPGLPLWLDEGLAEYFEVTPNQQGLNRPHVETLSELQRQGQWIPSLARLEQLENAGQMTQTDYAESWAWVQWLLDTTEDRRQLLQGYLQQVRKEGAAESILPIVQQSQPSAEHALIEHIDRLRG